jgi:tetratricopeptide (TPR) repeat protein
MEAVPVLEQAQKSGVEDPQMLMELADSYAYLGLYEKSLATLGLLERGGYVSAALYRRGLILREKGDFPGFIAEWVALINRPLTPDVENLNWDQVRLELAEACVARGMFAEAEEILSVMTASARSEFIQGKASYGLGDRNAAIEHWSRSIELQPTTTAPRFELAKVYFAEGKSDEARKILGPVTREVESASADVCNLMQMISVQQKDDESAAIWKARREAAEARSDKLGKLIRLSTRFDTITGKIIRAWKFASSGHQSQALTLLQPLLEEIEKSRTNSKGAAFVRKLDRSIREGSELPDLVELVGIEDAASQGQSQ